MHLLSTRPGGHVDDDGRGVVRVAQRRAPVVVLSAADTTLALLAEAAESLDASFPDVRLGSLLWLRQPASVDLYVEDVLRHARAVVVDHLGAPSDWAYLVEQLGSLARMKGLWLALFSGDTTEDPQLLLRSTAAPEDCRQLWRALREGGPANARGFFELIGHAAFGLGPRPAPPELLPPALVWRTRVQPDAPAALLVFYRAHLQAGNTAVFEALLQALAAEGMGCVALAVDSLKNPAALALLREQAEAHGVDVVLNATAFAVGNLGGAAGDGDAPAPLAGDRPVLQLIVAGSDRAQWQADPHGLAPRDLAMQVVMPEVDGRITTRAISFKGQARRSERTQIDLVRYQPEPERARFVAELARRLARLRRTPADERRVALILANYPNDDGRLANGVGLDTPASTASILRRLADEGYDLDAMPAGLDGQTLMQRLQQGVTNDAEANAWRPAWQSLALADYRAALRAMEARAPELGEALDSVTALWGPPERDPMLRQGRFMIPGLRWGKVFIGVQPARGRDLDLVASYHDADLVPTHHYLAFYVWLREHFRADAVVHVGKHGNLEWLPGKSVPLGAACWPDAVLGPLPHLYPFIVNDPGEGTQAKRRSQAVIIDHLMPALTRAETYGALATLERRMDEYFEALALHPARARRLREAIVRQVLDEGLLPDLGLAAPADAQQHEALLRRLDAYLCEIKESQIRDGLHVFGHSPTQRQRTDTLVALARFDRGPAPAARSLLAVLADDLGLGFDPLRADPGRPWAGPRPAVLQAQADTPWRHAGHTRERLELLAAGLVAGLPGSTAQTPGPRSQAVLTHLHEGLAPRLDASGELELAHLMDGLAGRFVPPGPSGAPSRGRPDVLPTGRNFYSVDSRAVPSPTAWTMGLAAAQALVTEHLQAHGRAPEAVGLSIWGTSTMRTGGEDLAQALALLGVRPKWADGSARVVDVELLPLVVLGRPRVDVSLRVSGFYRDAFGHLIDLFDTAVRLVAEADEPAEDNPVRQRVQRELAAARLAGRNADAARREATWRVFGPRPGGYGAGLQELIASGRWEGRGDLAQAYLRAGAFAYGQGGHGVPARAAFEQRLGALQAVVHNQDNREHDILDSDDYYQFQGGMAAAVEQLSGQMPALWHGDFSLPGTPRLRSLAQEIGRVVHARAVNPKWLDGVKRHGYKGAFEIAATVDYLFAFGATTGAVAAQHFARVAQAYVHDGATREFMAAHNPQALRSIGERLLEAMDRGLWPAGDGERRRIEDHLLQLDERQEAMGAEPMPMPGPPMPPN
ncbi:MAG: cobaltochelatase subunit CobN [Burkholderiales bacterium]|jgi:cobaltochelatase CobN|nr:cobaltochelatase subunit CobN [Burkholderiales bacterium]